MTLFRLHTNEGELIIESTVERLRKRMFEYIREKRSKGYSLSEVIFCWSRITVTRI